MLSGQTTHFISVDGEKMPPDTCEMSPNLLGWLSGGVQAASMGSQILANPGDLISAAYGRPAGLAGKLMRYACHQTVWVLVLLGISGCATKSVEPISMTQAGDDSLTCDQISGQIQANKDSALIFYERVKKVDRVNSAVPPTVAVLSTLAAGPLFAILAIYIASGSMDTSNEDQIKFRSLNDRNENLQFIQRKKKC